MPISNLTAYQQEVLCVVIQRCLQNSEALKVNYKAMASEFPSMKDEHSARTAWNQIRRKIATSDNNAGKVTANGGVSKACVPGKKRGNKNGAGDGAAAKKRSKQSKLVKEEVGIKKEGLESELGDVSAEERVSEWLGSKGGVDDDDEADMDEGEHHAEGEEEAV